MANGGQPELYWRARIPVWACDHLWLIAESGGQEEREAIAETATLFATDFGDGVALCPECESAGQHVVMTRRWVNTFWIDEDHQTLVDVGESQDSPALSAFEHPYAVK